MLTMQSNSMTCTSNKNVGIQFGVGPEAIELAAVLSFPKTPWLLSNALVHKPKHFNGKIGSFAPNILGF